MITDFSQVQPKPSPYAEYKALPAFVGTAQDYCATVIAFDGPERFDGAKGYRIGPADCRAALKDQPAYMAYQRHTRIVEPEEMASAVRAAFGLTADDTTDPQALYLLESIEYAAGSRGHPRGVKYVPPTD